MPTITTPAIPQAFAGVPYSFTLTATGLPPFRWVGASSLPGGVSTSGLSFNGNTGVILGTPPAQAQVSGAEFLVTCFDGTGNSANTIFYLDILPGTRGYIGGQLTLFPANGAPPQQIP